MGVSQTIFFYLKKSELYSSAGFVDMNNFCQPYKIRLMWNRKFQLFIAYPQTTIS